MIDIKKVSGKKDLIDFVKFPFKLYKESKYWVPPIIDQEINNFNKIKKYELFLGRSFKKST